ncbi:uncharacterized protein LOC129598888 [Paramacrobiotus metropolitanus]|uniref:uncharacterized protein LOC129598888 n=1 Tax=Paramacrobiotus metropolitanus TaxID=2943436 RepID=UPI002446489D|nr:uncharacterized protein LOC129598888 [Paramacrobiotus metropolitanus]
MEFLANIPSTSTPARKNPKRKITMKISKDRTQLEPIKRQKKSDIASSSSASALTGKHARYACTEQGLPVYKIGFDKFALFRWLEGGTKVVLAEFKEQPDGTFKPVDANKYIAMTINNFLRLCGLMLTGKADLVSSCPPLFDNGKLSPHYCLDDNLYFQWSRYNNMDLATVRRFNLSPNKDLYPTKVGISFGRKAYEGLKELVVDFTLLKEIRDTNEAHDVAADPKPGLASVSLKQELAEIMFRNIREHRENATGRTPMRGIATDEEWNTAEKDVLEKKQIHGVLLLLNQLDVGQCIDLDVDSYLAQFRKEVRAQLDKMMM